MGPGLSLPSQRTSNTVWLIAAVSRRRDRLGSNAYPRKRRSGGRLASCSVDSEESSALVISMSIPVQFAGSAPRFERIQDGYAQTRFISAEQRPPHKLISLGSKDRKMEGVRL